jgi:acetyl-CoA synthetase
MRMGVSMSDVVMIAANEYDQLGDISTLADPSVVKQLIEERARR